MIRIQHAAVTPSPLLAATPTETSTLLTCAHSSTGFTSGLSTALAILDAYPAVNQIFLAGIAKIRPRSDDTSFPLKVHYVDGNERGLARLCYFEDTGRTLGLNAASAFGGDHRGWVIGTTICALGRETDPLKALMLFLGWVLPGLLGIVDRSGGRRYGNGRGIEGTSNEADSSAAGGETVVSIAGEDDERIRSKKEKDMNKQTDDTQAAREGLNALRNCLLDEGRAPKIINEGQARGLDEVFEQSAETSNMWTGHCARLRQKFVENSEFDETFCVGGLLRWLTEGDEEAGTYFTISSLAARVAVYLRSVGWNVGTILSWDGEGDVPHINTSRAVVLVTGGSHPTDSLALHNGGFAGGIQTKPYRFNSVGRMLHVALGGVSRIDPHDFQLQFENAYRIMENILRVKFTSATANPLRYVDVKFSLPSLSFRPHRIAVKLASKHFPNSKMLFAAFYYDISRPDVLRNVDRYGQNLFPFNELPEDVELFRAVTASIVLAFFGIIADSDFRSLRHLTDLELISDDWLKSMCMLIDESTRGQLDYCRIVSAIAIIHCAAEYEHGLGNAADRVAWRNGRYSVVPSMALRLGASHDSVGIRLLDKFWGNVVPDEHGAILSGPTPFSSNIGETSDSLFPGAYIGTPAYIEPDVPLKLSIGRPLHCDRPYLSLVATVDGASMGSASILHAMRCVLVSHELVFLRTCTGHDDVEESAPMLIVKPSLWADCLNREIPISSQRHNFVPMKGDERWAVFLAAQCFYNGARIVRTDCPRCMVMRANSFTVCLGLGKE